MQQSCIGARARTRAMEERSRRWLCPTDYQPTLLPTHCPTCSEGHGEAGDSPIMPHDRTSASFTLAPGDDGPPPRCLCTCPTHAVHAAVRSIRRGHREELSRGGWVGGEWGKNCGVSGLRRNLINRSSNGASEQEFTAVEGTMRNVSYSGGKERSNMWPYKEGYRRVRSGQFDRWWIWHKRVVFEAAKGLKFSPRGSNKTFGD